MKRRYRLVACAAMLMASAVPAFSSVTWCSEPSTPWCLDQQFYDEFAADKCRSDVEFFIRETEDYVKCLNKGAEEAVEKSNEAVDRFNCKVRQQYGCY